MFTKEELLDLNNRFETAPTEEILAWALEKFSYRAAIGTSFQGAGLVMIHLAKQHGLKFPIFSIDTGLLFPETIELKERLENFFCQYIEMLQPDYTVEQQAEYHGPELWNHDPDLCCAMRKVVPLQTKLNELDCWITGLRRQQSDTRTGTPIVDVYVFGENRDIVKLSPMANWTRDAVWDYIKQHNIPYNPLHDRGYRSIGCWPCTRATGSGESERAGRWTGFGKIECGIHTFMPRKIDFQI
jgi:phosphoadenosine phosphosulfate reductase